MQFDADFATIVGEQEDIFIENFKRQMETLFDDTKVFITDVTVEEGNTPTPQLIPNIYYLLYKI